jgi:hypothetical protein
MPENELLPKTGKSKDWLDYADKKEKQFREHHSARNILGQIKNPQPLGDDYSKLLSNNALQARKMGMELLRKENKAAGKTSAMSAEGYRKGGRIKKSGPAKLHEGEKVITKTRKARKTGRSTARR